MERTELKGDLNVPYRFTEDAEEADKHVAGREGDRKAEDKMETDDDNWVKDQEKDPGTHKSKERESLKRTREERDASVPSSFDANGTIEDDRKSGKGSDERKVLEKDKERAQEREERDKEVLEGKKEELNLDGECGVREKEKNSSSGIQQKKRLLRPRGQANSTTSRSRFRPKEPEGLQARRDPSPSVYRAGEGMPELAKIRDDYLASLPGKGAGGASPGPTVDILIPAELVTTTNKQVRGSQLWGTDIYTDDSDIVAVLMHTGFYTPSSLTPPACVSELRATIRVLPPQDCYISTLRNSLRSRAWGAANMCSYSVEKCRIHKFGGLFIDLEPSLGFSPAAAPTLSIPAAERTVTTRAASANFYRQQRYMQEVTIQYNLCNEPWLKYNMNYVADKGLKKSQYTSARLKRGDVLYVETHFNRYELSYEGDHASTSMTAPLISHKSHATEKGAAVHESHTVNGEKNQAKTGDLPNADKHSGHGGQNQNGEIYERFRFAKCKIPMPLTMMRAKGVPLPANYVEVLETGLHWEEIQWSQTSVWVRQKEYALARAQFLSPNLDDMEED